MKIRLYIAPMMSVEDLDFGIIYKSKLNSYIDVVAGEGFTDFVHYHDTYSVAIVWANADTHAEIISDDKIVALSPLFADIESFRAALDLKWSNVPADLRLIAVNRLEYIGCSTSWITDTNTVRDVYRYLLRVIKFAQITTVLDQEIVDFIKANLTTTVNQLSQSVRTKITSWMKNKGLAIGWIDNSTTVREIIHYIVQNLGFGTIRFYDEDF